MSCPDHRIVRWRAFLVLSSVLVGCTADVDVFADVTVAPDDVVERDQPDGVEVPSDAQDALSDVMPSDVVLSVPDAIVSPDLDAADLEEASDITGPPSELPADKATWHCEADIQCAGCAGEGGCVEGVCSYDESGCVILDPDEKWGGCYSDGELAPGSTCLQCRSRVSPDRWSGVWVSCDFESGLDVFDWVENMGAPEATWSVSSTWAYGGQFSAHFGNAETGTYASSGRSWGRITTYPMHGEAGVSGTLQFWLWLETEETPGYDIFRVLMLSSEGEEILWSSESIGGTTGGEWQLVQLDVQGPPNLVTRFVFEFDTGDDVINNFEGVYIDGVILSTGCCVSDRDCVTTNVCASGYCGDDGHCQWTPVMGCCYEPEDCPKTGACMEPICSGPGGTCGEVPLNDCCLTASDCDDNDMCTEELCAYPGAPCEHLPLCCAADFECLSDNPCHLGKCEGGECTYVDRCCDVDADCDDGNGCTVGECTDGLCLTTILPVEGCCIEQIFTENFDGGFGLTGWSFGGFVNGVGWTVAMPNPALVPSPPGTLYYGNPETWNYNSGGANQGEAWTPFFTLPLGTEISLSFDLFMDVKPGLATDRLTLHLHGPGGWQAILTKADLEPGEWLTPTVDLSALSGYEIQLAFEFDTVNNLQNNGLGVFIDNLSIETSCAPEPCVDETDCESPDHCVQGTCLEGVCSYEDVCCQLDPDCDDGDVCTTDNCINQQCENVPVAECCTDAEDCSDGDICTLDVCTGYGGTCFHLIIDGCCHNSGECDDEVACTVDQCLQNVCAHQDVCCVNAVECDDGDDICTIDDCVDGICTHAPTGLAGCCLETPISWDFESPQAFELTATAPPCGWYVMDVGTASSGTTVLYYGDPGVMTFSCGHNAGTATSPPITLMPGFAYTLTFDANLDVESNNVYDTIDLYVVIAGEETLVWDKSEMVMTDTWLPHTVDLSAFAGQTFRLRYDFDTQDDVANDSTGVYIDDIEITSTCLTKPCTDDQACDDKISGTSESCGLNGCQYNIP